MLVTKPQQILGDEEFIFNDIQGTWYEISVYPYIHKQRYIEINITSETTFDIQEYEYLTKINDIVRETIEKAISNNLTNNRVFHIESPINSRIIDIKYVDTNNYLYIFQPLNLSFKIPHFTIYCRRPTVTKNVYCDLRESMKCFGIEPFRLIIFPEKIVKQEEVTTIETYDI